MKTTNLISGIIYSVQYLVLLRDEPTFAEELMKESGYSMNQFLREQRKTDHETSKINKVIRSAFKKSK